MGTQCGLVPSTSNREALDLRPSPILRPFRIGELDHRLSEAGVASRPVCGMEGDPRTHRFSSFGSSAILHTRESRASKNGCNSIGLRYGERNKDNLVASHPVEGLCRLAEHQPRK